METLKAVRKDSLRSEPLFLYELNRKIMTTSYDDYPNNSIIVSLTTHGSRIEYIHYVLDSLYFQTLRPSNIRLFIAKQEYQAIPDILKKFEPWLMICETEDIGSYKKFIPALKEIQENQVLISLDDDFIYPPHLIASLYSLYLKYPDSLIGYCGFKNGKDFFNGIAGGMGILWNPKIISPKTLPFFFDEDLFWSGIERNIDDAWIVLSMLHKQIPIQCLNDRFYECKKDFISLPNEKIDAISASGKGKNYISKEEKERLKQEILKRINQY